VTNKYWIIARDKPGLLIAMMKAYAGNAHMSFEGNLSACNLNAIGNINSEETDSLRRNLSYPKKDFLIIPLSQETIKPILAAILPDNR